MTKRNPFVILIVSWFVYKAKGFPYLASGLVYTYNFRDYCNFSLSHRHCKGCIPFPHIENCAWFKFHAFNKGLWLQESEIVKFYCHRIF